MAEHGALYRARGAPICPRLPIAFDTKAVRLPIYVSPNIEGHTIGASAN
jgi:hypothetical protein